MARLVKSAVTLFAAMFLVVTITTLAIFVAVMVPFIFVAIDLVYIDCDASASCATNPLANGRGVATDSNHRGGRNLWNENAVALGVCAATECELADCGMLLDQHTGSVDDAELQPHNGIGVPAVPQARSI